MNRVGDKEGAKFELNRVKAAPGFAEAYRQWTAGGWNAITGPSEYGGMALPVLLNTACIEIWSAANMAFSLCPLLTLAAIEAVQSHASGALKAVYLAKLVSGEWSGTMNLTEPQAGSDLGALKTRAERRQDGTYKLFGSKIFITYGEHDMTENIVHFVLARLPDAPKGTRGISLFLVPKFFVDADGAVGPATMSIASRWSINSVSMPRPPARWSMAIMSARRAFLSARRTRDLPACSR